MNVSVEFKMIGLTNKQRLVYSALPVITEWTQLQINMMLHVYIKSVHDKGFVFFFCTGTSYFKNKYMSSWLKTRIKWPTKNSSSKLFVRHSSGYERRNERKKNLIDLLIKMNEDDWMFEKGVKTRDQRKIFEI